MKTLYLAWQDSFTRCWYPVGCLTTEYGKYRFVYIQGSRDAQASGFRGLPAFPDMSAAYESDELFPLFANRLMARSRPDYADFVEWLSVPEHPDDPLALLARSGGQRATGDTLAIYPGPEQDSAGKFHLHFFVHGLRHLGRASNERVVRLKKSERLLLMIDAQNSFDPEALMLRTADPEDTQLVGWFPSYLAREVKQSLENASFVAISVERVNPEPTPVQFLLLCNVTFSSRHGFPFFRGESYQPVTLSEHAFTASPKLTGIMAP